MATDFLNSFKRLIQADKRVSEASVDVMGKIVENYNTQERIAAEQQKKVRNVISTNTRITKHRISL